MRRPILSLSLALLLLAPIPGSSAVTGLGFHPAELSAIRHVPAWTDLRGADEGIAALAILGRRLGLAGLRGTDVAAVLRNQLQMEENLRTLPPASLELLAEAARELGLDATLEQPGAEGLRKITPGNGLVQLQDRFGRLHVRILERVDSDPLRLFHPRRGSLRMHRRDFLAAWDGRVLALNLPGKTADPGHRLKPLPPEDPRWVLRKHLPGR